MAFDLLHQEGRELTGRPLRDRRARLENAVAGSDMVLPVRRLAKNGFRGVGRGDRARLRGPGRQGRGEPVRGGADSAVVEGEAEGLDRRRRPLAAADQHWRMSPRSA